MSTPKSKRRTPRPRKLIRESFVFPASWTPFQLAEQPKDHPITTSLTDLDDAVAVLLNNRYQVSVCFDRSEPVDCVHLSIKDLAKTTRHDWRDLQRIKSEVCGAEAAGVEIYPPESRLVDTANQYHLWCYPGSFAVMGWSVRMTSQDPGYIDQMRTTVTEAGGTEEDFQAVLSGAEQREHLDWHRTATLPADAWVGWDDNGRAVLLR